MVLSSDNQTKTRMALHPDQDPVAPLPLLSNAEIADRLASLAQLLSSQKENPYKVKAYQRAAARIRNLSESLDEMVRDQEDLTRFAGIGEAIASAIREIVTDGNSRKTRKTARAGHAGRRQYYQPSPAGSEARAACVQETRNFLRR